MRVIIIFYSYHSCVPSVAAEPAERDMLILLSRFCSFYGVKEKRRDPAALPSLVGEGKEASFCHLRPRRKLNYMLFQHRLEILSDSHLAYLTALTSSMISSSLMAELAGRQS